MIIINSSGYGSAKLGSISGIRGMTAIVSSEHVTCHTQRPIAIYCPVLFCIGDYKNFDLL